MTAFYHSFAALPKKWLFRQSRQLKACQKGSDTVVEFKIALKMKNWILEFTEF